MKIDDEPLFQTLTENNKARNNETSGDTIGDDEDVNEGSGSGNIEIEIEEDPLITNTTDDLNTMGK